MSSKASSRAAKSFTNKNHRSCVLRRSQMAFVNKEVDRIWREVQELHDTYKNKRLRKVPLTFVQKVTALELLFPYLDDEKGWPEFISEYNVRALNKKYNLHVFVPPGLKFLLRGDFYDTWDMDVCSKCKFDQRKPGFVTPLQCDQATVDTIQNVIVNSPIGTEKILFPITVFFGFKTKREEIYCKQRPGSQLHANCLVLDIKNKKMSAYDSLSPASKGTTFKLAMYYKRFFSNICKKLGYKYEIASDGCSFIHSGMCRYAIFSNALDLNFDVQSFISFVVYCLGYRLRKSQQRRHLIEDI